MIQPDAKADSPNEVSAGNLPPDEQPISSLPPDEVGELIERLTSFRPYPDQSIVPPICTEAASTLSRLRGERDMLLYRQSGRDLAYIQMARALSDSEAACLKAEDLNRKLVEEWDWLAAHGGLELDKAEIDEGEMAWRIHRVNGGRNDREWTLIATGETPLEVVRKARSLLSSISGGEAAGEDGP